uniref:Alpha/beta hydrolase protein, putative n=1 Tax=Babesia bovis TaxID=5865 RepID=A7AUM3_BABBO|eukprot:XP_001610202.1 alpha/beta hydrolase protein [Babesia bovis T2Bo]
MVVTFHGLNASHSAFDDYSKVLASNGYTVVSFDLYGHGLSEIPRYDVFGKRYSLDFLVDQAEDVLEYFNLHDRKITVMGISMGGCIAAAFCDRHPERVERLILISPAGLIPKCPIAAKVVKTLHCLIPCVPLCVCRCCFVAKDKINTQDKLTNHMLWRLYVAPKSSTAMLGIIKRVPLWTAQKLYKRVGAMGKPTLIIFGGKDSVTPPSCAAKLQQLFVNSHVVIFPEACHLASYMIPTAIASTSLAFLSVSTDDKASRYAYWLPFGPNGTYIPRDDRHILNDSEAESSQQFSDDEELLTTPITTHYTETSKIANKSHSRGTLFSKKALVVVNQYEGGDIGTNELLTE